jgi:drug/metabolite transporter (DMT)-like permease
VKPLLGILLKLISALAFTVMAAEMKIVSARYPIGEIVFFRSLFALVPLLVWLAWQGHLIDSIRTRNPKGHLVRGAIGCCGMFSGFAALSLLPLPDAVALGYAVPLIVVALAGFLLKEKVGAYRWSAVAIGFVGVVIMLAPQIGQATADATYTLGAGIALFASFCNAGAVIQVRRLTETEETGAIVLYFSLLTTVMGLATIVFGWRMPDLMDGILLVSIGVLGGIGQILVTQSYRYADTSVIAPFEYTTMIWALLIGWFLFGDLPSVAVLVGAAIVAVAGVLVLWGESARARSRNRRVEANARRPGNG